MKYLALWLEGPLQSWGVNSKFDVRETFSFPTKSGVFGLLLAASGDSGPQEELLQRMQRAPMVAYACRLTDHEVPPLRDFHMIGNGYDRSNPWQKLHTTRTSDGKEPVGGGAKLTYRYYLQDKAFGVIIGFDDDLAVKFDKALKEPQFDLFLGRKCCVPSELIGRGCYDNEEQAYAVLTDLAKQKNSLFYRKAWEVDEMDEDTWILDDVPLRFGTHKIYKERLVRIEPLENESLNKADDAQ